MVVRPDLATVGMVSSYPNLAQADWLWQQTPEAFGTWGNIQLLAQHDRPDFLLLYQYDFPKPPAPPAGLKQQIKQLWRSPPPPPDPAVQFRGVPPERMIYLLREPPLAEVVATNQRNYAAAQTYCGFVSGPDDFAPTPAVMPAIWYHSNSFRELNDLPPPPKLHPCSWITSGVNRTANHRRRLDFLRSVQASDLPVSCFGRGLPDWVESIGAVSNKWHVMAPFRYNLAIENYADNDWYVSEKLWDALLAWCLPIYYGGPAADRLLPPGSFIRLPSLDADGLALIRDVISTPDAWHEAQAAIAEARQIILHQLNLLNWLSDYVAEHR